MKYIKTYEGRSRKKYYLPDEVKEVIERLEKISVESNVSHWEVNDADANVISCRIMGVKYSDPLYLQFNYGIYVNLSFFIFTTLYFLFLRNSEHLLDWNNFIGNLLGPTIFGLLFLFYVFCLIIYFAIKSKFITKIQSLNTFIVLICVIVFLALIQGYFFMQGLENVCTNKILAEERSQSNFIELLNWLLYLFCDF